MLILGCKARRADIRLARDSYLPPPNELANLVGTRKRRADDSRYRCDVTPTLRHISSTTHVEHFGRTLVQMCLPNGTSNRLMSIRWGPGNNSSSAAIVCSGEPVFTTPQ